MVPTQSRLRVGIGGSCPILLTLRGASGGPVDNRLPSPSLNWDSRGGYQVGTVVRSSATGRPLHVHLPVV